MSVLELIALPFVLIWLLLELAATVAALTEIPRILRDARESLTVAVSWATSIMTGTGAILAYFVWKQTLVAVGALLVSVATSVVAVALPEVRQRRERARWQDALRPERRPPAKRG
jgi:lipid-A-disaccharide synthase-like uncharacterized protein